MKKALLVALCMAVLTLALAPAAMAQTKVKVGTEGAYPPFNGMDEKGQLVGFDIDIANALCEQAGFECEFVVVDWDGLIPALLAKKIDCIIASMSITEERKEKVDFTKKYYQTPARFVAKKGAGIEISKEALKGKTVGVQRATVSENFIRDNFGDVLDIKSYAKQEEANMDLVSGRVDLVFADQVVLQGGLIETPEGADFEFIGPAYLDEQWFGEGIGIAVRKGEPELVEGFNKAILAIRENGSYKTINDKYFDFDLYGK